MKLKPRAPSFPFFLWKGWEGLETRARPIADAPERYNGLCPTTPALKAGESCAHVIDNTILMPHHSVRHPRRRGLLLLVILVLAFILFGGRTTISYYVDALWFASLGYSSVFWKSLSLQWTVFAVFFAVTFIALYGWFLILMRVCRPELSQRQHHRDRHPHHTTPGGGSIARRRPHRRPHHLPRHGRKHHGRLAEIRPLLVPAACAGRRGRPHLRAARWASTCSRFRCGNRWPGGC